MVVDADVTDVRRHYGYRPLAPDFEELRFSGGVELEDRAAELEALGPLGPAARGVLAAGGEHGRALLGTPAAFERADLSGGELEEAAQFRDQCGGCGCSLGVDHVRVILT